MMINVGELLTGLAGAALFAVASWVVAKWRRQVFAAVVQRWSAWRQARVAQAAASERAWLIAEATSANEKVLVRIVGRSPRRALWEGACREEEFYFDGDRRGYRRAMLAGETPHLKSYPGSPPPRGTRRPCSC